MRLIATHVRFCVRIEAREHVRKRGAVMRLQRIVDGRLASLQANDDEQVMVRAECKARTSSLLFGSACPETLSSSRYCTSMHNLDIQQVGNRSRLISRLLLDPRSQRTRRLNRIGLEQRKS